MKLTILTCLSALLCATSVYAQGIECHNGYRGMTMAIRENTPGKFEFKFAISQDLINSALPSDAQPESQGYVITGTFSECEKTPESPFVLRCFSERSPPTFTGISDGKSYQAQGESIFLYSQLDTGTTNPLLYVGLNFRGPRFPMDLNIGFGDALSSPMGALGCSVTP